MALLDFTLPSRIAHPEFFEKFTLLSDYLSIDPAIYLSLCLSIDNVLNITNSDAKRPPRPGLLSYLPVNHIEASQQPPAVAGE